MESKRKRVLIVGGYGMVGSSIARLIRKRFQNSVELILAGRNPQSGEELANALTYAKTAYLNLDEGFDLSLYGKVDLIITSVEDHRNIIREAAISHGIANIYITEVAEEISPTMFLALHRTITAPIVFAGHWQAGVMVFVTKYLCGRFRHITRIETAGLFDERDPIGPMVASQVEGFVGRALLREEGKWRFVDAKAYSREIMTPHPTPVIGYPMSSLDVPSIAAFTGAANIRFDFATGKSIGTHNGLAASHDLYIDIEGVLLSGETTKLRTIVSDPGGNSHLTAVGVILLTEAILYSGEESDARIGGLYLPETLVSSDGILDRLAEFGINFTEANH